MNLQREQPALWAVIIVSAAIRIASSVAFPWEQDEFYTIAEATDLFHTRVPPGIQARPFFFFLEHPFVTLLPHTPLLLRAIAVVFGVAGVVAVWMLGRRVLGLTGAIVSAVLVAVSPWHLYASAFARYYSLIFLLAAVVYWQLPRAYDSDRPRDLLVALLPLLIGTWTHPSFIFPIVGASVAVSLVSRNGVWGWRWPSHNAWRYLWGPYFIGSVLIFGAIRFIAPRGPAVTNGSDRGLLATLRLVPAMVDWATPTIVVAALLGAIFLLRSGRLGERRFGLMVIMGGCTTVVALFLLSLITAVYADYGIAALPLVIVAAAGLVTSVARHVPAERRRSVAAAVTILLLVGVFPSAASYLSDGTRFDYRPAFARIEREAPTLAVLTWPIPQQQAYAPQLRAMPLPTGAAQLESALGTDRDLWAVVSVKRYGIVGDDRGDMASWLSSHCRLRDQYQKPRFDYRMYRVDLWRCAASDSGHQAASTSSGRTSAPPLAFPN